MLDRLDSGVVVILMNFFVHSGCHVLVPLRLDVFLRNSLAGVLVDGGRVFSILGDEVMDGLFGFLHDGGWLERSVVC